MAMNTRNATPLLAALEQLAPRTHLCSIYETPEEHFAVAVPFIKIGLDRGEKCIYIADDGTDAAVRETLLPRASTSNAPSPAANSPWRRRRPRI